MESNPQSEKKNDEKLQNYRSNQFKAAKLH